MAAAQMLPPYSLPPSLDDLELMARAALGTLPKALRGHVGDVVIRIEDFPDEDTLDDMDLDSAFDLLGLYRGVAMGRKSVMDVNIDVDMIFLYRRPLLDYWCETGVDLYHLVRHVLVHEIGHHFGLSDEDMERIEAQE